MQTGNVCLKPSNRLLQRKRMVSARLLCRKAVPAVCTSVLPRADLLHQAWGIAWVQLAATSSTNEGRWGQPEAAQSTKGLVTEGGFFIWWWGKECQGKIIWHLTSSTWGTYSSTMGEEQHCLVGNFSVTVEMSCWAICPDSSSLSCTRPVHFVKITGGCSDVLLEWKRADTEKAQEITNNKLWTWNHALIFF